MARNVVWIMVGLFWAWLWCSTPTARAGGAAEAQELAARYELALWVARVAANEGALKNRPEAALVWQTTRTNGKDTTRRTDWLARHSPRVHGTRPCGGGNCMWSANLTREAALPAGLLLRLDQWEIRVAPLWLDTLRYVDWMVLGDRTSEDPCHVPPRTWGCELDRARALTKGLYPIGCRGTSDDGYTYAKNCWQGARGWVCDPLFEPAAQTEDSMLTESFASAY